MKSRILVYSPEVELRHDFTSWGQQEDSFEVQIVDQPDALSDAIRSGDLAAVIVDDSDGALPLPALTHHIATRHPLARILVFPPSADSNPSVISDAILNGYLSKPFSADELNSALRGLPVPEPIQVKTNPNPNLPPLFIMTGKRQDFSDANEPHPEVKPEDENLDYLVGWLFEDSDEGEPIPVPALPTGADIVNALDITGVPGEAGKGVESSPFENNDPDTDPERLPQITAEITDADPVINTAAITPAELQTLKSTFTPSSEAPFMEQSAGQNKAGNPPVNLHSLRLHYSCVLIPRNPQHYLVGELADRLSLVLPQAHLKHGWRVTGTSIRPQYMQWSADLPLETSPVEAISEIRELTSSCVLTNLPELKNSTGEEDFWAPGYLILSGNLPTPPSLIREFIQRTGTLAKSET